MSRKSDDSIGGVLLILLIIIALPIMFFIWIIKACVGIGKYASKQSKASRKNDDIDDLEFDEMNDIWDEMDNE